MSFSGRSPTISVWVGEIPSAFKRASNNLNTCGSGLANPLANEKKQSSDLRMVKDNPAEAKAASSSRRVYRWQLDARPRSTLAWLAFAKTWAASGERRTVWHRWGWWNAQSA